MATIDDALPGTRDHALNVLHKLILANRQSPPTEQAVQEWVAVQAADGHFNDLDYPPNHLPVADVGVLTEHIQRLRRIGDYCDAHLSSKYADNAASGLQFYVAQDYRPQNNWFRTIGLARTACIAAMLVCQHVPHERMHSFLQYIEACTNLDTPATGANRSDHAHIQLMWASVGHFFTAQAHFTQRMKQCYQVMTALCFAVPRQGPPDNGEGFVVDRSFSQHNVARGDGSVYHQLYTAGYGTEMVKSIFRFIAAASGEFTLDDDARAMTEIFIIDGMAWMSYGSWFDAHVMGRGIAGPTKHAGEVMNWARTLLDHDPQRPEVLNEIVHRINQNDETANSYYQGSRYFWINEYLCHIRRDFYVRCKNISNRTVGSESGNGANLKGYYVGNGTTFFGVRGDEYKDMQVVWDWQRLPGTTVEQIPDFEFPLIEWGKGAWGSSDYSGGVWGPEAGMSSMVLSKGAVSNARKSVFTCGSRAFFLGSGINTLAATHPVITTVNQCLNLGGRAEMLEETDQFAAFFHNGLYYNISKYDNQVVSYLKEQQGRWRDINTSGTDELIKKDVYSIQIEHPASANARYAYEVRNRDVGGQIPVILCNENMHIVNLYSEKIAFAALFDVSDMAPVSIRPGLAFTSSVPIMVYFEYSNGPLRIYCADPLQCSESVQFDFYNRGTHIGKVAVQLDSGEFAGATKRISHDLKGSG